MAPFLLGSETVSRTAALLTVLIAALYLSHAALFEDYIADDAGISLAYARNMARGFGPVLYPGAEAVEAYSNPLWTALLAFAAALRLDGANGIPLLKVMGLLCGGAVLALTVIAAPVLYPGEVRVRWLAPALLALWTPFVFWTGSGLENPLYALLLLAAATLQMREIRAADLRPWSAVALLGVALTRPEGCAFFAAFLLHRLLASRSLRGTATWVMLFVVPYALFLGTRNVVFGDWVPNTYHAKIFYRELSELPAYLSTRNDPGLSYAWTFALANWPLMMAALAGLLDIRQWRSNLLIAGIVGGMSLYAVYVGGDFWPQWRFLTALLPLIALLVQHAVNLLARRVWLTGQAVAALVLAVVLYHSIGASLDLRRRHAEDSLISLQGRLKQAHRIRALAESLGIQDPLYMDPDIGGPAVAGLRVLDLGGLADIHIARFHYYPPFFRDYVFRERRPHLIRTHSMWTRSSRITQYPEFREQYVAISETRDALGLHGEFVRKDLLSGAREQLTAAPPPASWRQAIADQRARRLREDRRERQGWIEYYPDHGLYAKLLRAFREHEEAGTLPREQKRLEELYYGLLAAGDAASAERIRAAAGFSAPPRVILLEDGSPKLTLLAHRVVRREGEHAHRIQLFFRVDEPPRAEYDLTLEIRAPAGAVRHIEHEILPPLPARRVGDIVPIEKAVEAETGEHEISLAVIEPETRRQLCPHSAGASCRLRLGKYWLPQ